MNDKKLDNELYDSSGINKKTYELLFSDFNDLPENERGTYDNEKAFVTIDRFTKLQEKKIFTKLLTRKYKKADIDFDKITYNKALKQFEYRDGNRIITFDKVLKKELMSNERCGKCHLKSVIMAPKIENSKIVTGYMTMGNRKILHSIIECNVNNEIMVIDWTKNLYITKEQYVELTEFVELASFNSKEVYDDRKILDNNLFKSLSLKTYVVFRDELMNDIKKNSQIFESSKEENSIEDEEDIR